MLFHEGVDDILLQRGKDLDIALGIVVRDVQPELVETVWGRAVTVEPYITALRLAELLAVALGNTSRHSAGRGTGSRNPAGAGR